MFVTVLDTTDVDDACDIVGHIYNPHFISPFDNGAEFHAKVRTASIANVFIDQLAYSSDVDVVPLAPIGSQICVMHTRRGHLDVRSNGELAPLDPGLSVALDETRLFAMRWYPGAWVLNLRMPVTAVRRHVNELAGEPVEIAHFTFGNPPDATRQQRWERVMRFAEQLMVASPAVDQDGLWAAEFERFMVASLLQTHPNSVLDERLRRSDQRVSSIGARQAAELMTAECHESMTVAEIAARVGVSVRTLQLGFQQVYGTTPREYLREIRLQRAHDELVLHPEATVAEVAYRWGFSTPSRFAAHHRRVFGVPPSQLRTVPRPEHGVPPAFS